LIGTATAVVAIAALVSFWQQRGDSTRRLGEDDTPDSSTEPKPIGIFGIILMGVILMIFLVGVVTRHNVAPSLVRRVFDMRGEGGDAADLPKTDGDKPPSLREYVAANPRNGAAYIPSTCCAWWVFVAQRTQKSLGWNWNFVQTNISHKPNWLRASPQCVSGKKEKKKKKKKKKKKIIRLPRRGQCGRAAAARALCACCAAGYATDCTGSPVCF
jgi:hypothetical protein